MKKLILFLFIISLVVACNSTKQKENTVSNEANVAKTGDTITLSGDNIEYDIIIIEPGYGAYLAGRARPKGFYSQMFLEQKNIRLVQAWNSRVLQPRTYNPNLYELQIDYRIGIDYGYDVNYKLYNYFLFFQNKYNQNLLNTRVPPN